MARPIGEINASSMADIAFLLLIFFLVTTTMNVDTGLARMLPPMPPPNQKMDDEPKVKERNVLEVLVNRADKLLVENQPLDISMLREKAREFILNPQDLPNLPEKEEIEVDFFGRVRVGKGVISLQNDRFTSYEMYLKVQNELVAAYNELREELARNHFGKTYKDLTDAQQKAVSAVYPQRISEAEPKGKK